MYSAGSDGTTQTNAANPPAIRNSRHAEKETQLAPQFARALSAIPNKPASRCCPAPAQRAAAEFPGRAPRSGGISQAQKATACSQAARSAKSQPYKHSAARGRRRDSSKWADWQNPRETAPGKENRRSGLQ